jgi:hypothetical protein
VRPLFPFRLVLIRRSQVGDVKHSDLPGMEALGREGKLLGLVYDLVS